MEVVELETISFLLIIILLLSVGFSFFIGYKFHENQVQQRLANLETACKFQELDEKYYVKIGQVSEKRYCSNGEN